MSGRDERPKSYNLRYTQRYIVSANLCGDCGNETIYDREEQYYLCHQCGAEWSSVRTRIVRN